MEAITVQRPFRVVSASLSVALGWLLALLAVLAGMGVLYLIRDESLLRAGPEVGRALPLEQLARQDAQPLGHMLIAWVPAGFAAGLALASRTRIRWVARTLSVTALAAVALLLSGALSDAIAVNDSLSPHLVPQLGRDGTWVAVALFGIGAASSELARPWRAGAVAPTRR